VPPALVPPDPPAEVPPAGEPALPPVELPPDLPAAEVPAVLFMLPLSSLLLHALTTAAAPTSVTAVN
jgi:hypothetical protein